MPSPARSVARTPVLLPLFAALSIAVPPPARAQGGGEPERIARGVALRQQGRDDAAFVVLREAWERFGTPRAEAHLGLCAQALGRWVEAERHLAAALAADNDRWIADKRSVLVGALAAVRTRVGSLEVDVEGNGEAARLSVDGQPVGPLPLNAPLRLAAGTVAVQVEAPGYLPLQRPVTIVGGQLSRERFALVPLPPPGPVPLLPAPPAPVEHLTVEPTPPPPPPAAPDRRSALFWLSSSATAVAAGLTIWSGMQTLSARDRYQRAPTESGYRDGLHLQRRTNALLIGTGALAVTSLTLKLFSLGKAP